MGLIPGAGGVPCGSDGKEYTSNAGDLRTIPQSEDPRRREYLVINISSRNVTDGWKFNRVK